MHEVWRARSTVTRLRDGLAAFLAPVLRVREPQQVDHVLAAVRDPQAVTVDCDAV